MGFKKSTSPKSKAKPKKPKRKTLGQLHKKLVTLVQKWSRISRADDKGYVLCFTCGKVMHYKQAHGGHYVPKSIYATRYDKDNLRPQCAGCNIFRGGNLITYRENLVAELGERAVWSLEQHRKRSIDFTREWLEVEITAYDREIRILEKGLPS